MKLTLDAEQRAIKDSAQRFFATASPVAAMRALRDRRDPLGYDAAVWQRMAEMGFPAVTLGADHGGLALGYKALGAVFEEAGRTLAASPLFATAVLGASVIELCGSSQQQALLALVAEGSLTLALAAQETGDDRWEQTQCTATRHAGGYTLAGRKPWVIDGGSAHRFIVLARTSGAASGRDGLSFFLVPAAADGLTRTPLQMADSRNAAALALDDVQVADDALIGHEGAAWGVLEQVAQRARAMLACEMLGGSLALFEQTLAYLGTREQFGVKISSFQALRHRAAQLYTELELTRSAVMAALAALDEALPDGPALACLAKCRANDTYRRVSNEAVQMHGGIGVTDELDVGLFLKRSRVAMQTFGDSRSLRSAYASLKGY